MASRPVWICITLWLMVTVACVAQEPVESDLADEQGSAAPTDPQGVEPLITFIDLPKEHTTRLLGHPPRVLVRYASALDPASLRVTLNGKDVSAFFHPGDHLIEQVELPFVEGANEVRVEASTITSDAPEVRRHELIKVVEYEMLRTRSLFLKRDTLSREEYAQFRAEQE